MKGVVTSYHFDQEMDAYAKNNVKQYLFEHKDDGYIQWLLQRLRDDALLDQQSGEFGKNTVPQLPGESAPLEQQLLAAVKYMQWSLEKDPEQHPYSPITLLKDSICKDGQEKKALKTQVFRDAVNKMKEWRFGQQFIKNYILDVPDSDDQEKLMQFTTMGDIRQSIANYIRLGQAERALLPRTYKTLTAILRSDPENILFLTNSKREAAVALEQKYLVILIRRPGEPVPNEPDVKVQVPVASSYDQIHFINDPNRPIPCC